TKRPGFKPSNLPWCSTRSTGHAGSMAVDSRLIERNQHITAYREAGHWLQAVAVLAEIQTSLQPSIVSFGAATSVCEKASQWRHALGLWQRTARQSLRPNMISQSAALGSCSRAKLWQRSFFLLGFLKLQTARPNVVSYSCAASVSKAVWRRGSQMLSAMQRNTVQANLISYSPALAVARWPGALALLLGLKARDLQLDVVAQAAAIAACEDEAKWEAAVALLQVPFALNVIAYSSAMTACEKASTWQTADGLLREMRSCSLRPDLVAYNALISACARATQWRAALAGLQELELARLQPNIVTCNAAITACQRAQAWGKAFQLFGQMRSRDVVSYSAAASAAAAKALWAHSLWLLEGIGHQRLRPDLTFLTAILGGLSRSWQRALLTGASLGSEAEGDAARSNVVGACCRGARWEVALRLSPGLLSCCELARGLPGGNAHILQVVREVESKMGCLLRPLWRLRQ
ncbi:unnamed protein product, partial [Effrenium voratum]